MSPSLKTSSKAVKPEKRVEQAVLFWCHQQGWSVDVFDSKATYSQYSKSYRKNRSVVEGFPDICGSDRQGFCVYVELKAPGLEDKCRQEQYMFLTRKIEANCFVIVTSSVEHLKETYRTWLDLRSDAVKAREYLRSQLPKSFLAKSGRMLSAT